MLLVEIHQPLLLDVLKPSGCLHLQCGRSVKLMHVHMCVCVYECGISPLKLFIAFSVCVCVLAVLLKLYYSGCAG